MQETQQTKPKKSRKKLWIILGVVAVALILILIALFIIGLLVANRYSTSTSSYRYSDSGYGLSDSFESMDLSESKSSLPEASEESVTRELESTADTAAGSDNDASSGELTEQKVIKTGYITLQVKRAGDSVVKLTDLAKSRGGFVLSSSIYTSSDETQSGTVTLKVPVSQYEETMKEIKNLGDVQRETSSGQDVTEQYADLQAQLKNYKAGEEQYLKILEKAESVDDILKVTKQLSLVRENIEVTEGRIKYLESQTDMSTITVTLSEETRIDVPTKEWKPLETLKQAFRSWIQFLQGLVDIAIWAVIFLGPIAIVIYVIIKLIIRRVKKNKKEKLE